MEPLNPVIGKLARGMKLGRHVAFLDAASHTNLVTGTAAAQMPNVHQMKCLCARGWLDAIIAFCTQH